MDEQKDDRMNMAEIPGTAQIRKIGSKCTSMELLEMAAKMAEEGYDKKMFSVLSRVYTEKKGFHYNEEEGIAEPVARIVASNVPSELKMQTFTSFELPLSMRPDVKTAQEWVDSCANNRLNIAVYFLSNYGYSAECASFILAHSVICRMFIKSVSGEVLLSFFESIMDQESKEQVTGVIRAVRNTRRPIHYQDRELLKRVTDKVFAAKNVFYTSKILYCMAFRIPREFIPAGRELYKMMKIAVNYDEKTAKEFVRLYRIDFDVSDAAMCRYFLGNKKAEKEKPLVTKFASHVVLVSEEERRKLLRAAFKRGGLFRMYAGCMQDGYVNEDKQRHFHYSDELIAWVKTMPGLAKEKK